MKAQYFLFIFIGLFGVWFGATNDGSFPVELRWFFGFAGLTLVITSLAKLADLFNEEHYS